MQLHRTNLKFNGTLSDRKATEKIVVHHTAGPASQTVEQIHAFHRNVNKWAGIGYNIIQTADGDWYEGRGLDKAGAHASGHNSTTIGICLTGNFEDNPLPRERWESLVEMCLYLCDRYELRPKDIIGHQEIGQTLCPGKNVDVEALRAAVQAKIDAAAAEEVSEAPIYRVIVDGIQIGAYRDPSRAVMLVLREAPSRIVIERVEQ